ncbi:unnamed protein product, partial [Rotaria sp. Silwood1]
MNALKKEKTAPKKDADSSNQQTVITLDATDTNLQGRIAQEEINKQNDHVATLYEDRDGKPERKVVNDDSKIGSELSYIPNERKTDFSEEQTDDNQKQRVEVMKDGRVATDQQMSERHHVSGDLIVVENQKIPKEMNNNDTDFAPIVA